jgi:class 3 adenylate cyclase
MKELSRIFAKFDSIMEQNNCIRIKTAGNVYLAASGIFEQDSHFALSLAKAAQECRKYIEESSVDSKIKFQIRIGINSGNVAGALIGNKRFSYDLFGDDVDIAQKLKSGAAFGQIVISWSTYKQVAGSFICNKQDSLNIDGYGKIESYLLEDEIL